MTKTFSALIILLIIVLAGFGVYYFYTYPKAEVLPELTNPALLNFPGSESVFYKDYLAYNNDTRLSEFELVVDYASRNGEEVALVKEDINATETHVLIASDGNFAPLYVADGGEKRMVDISPTGAYIAYSFFSGPLEEGGIYGNVDEWQTRIVNTQSGYIEREIPGYAPQFVTDNTVLVGTSGGVLLYDIQNKSFKETGIRFRVPVGIIPFRVNADASHLAVLDLHADMYHILSITNVSTFSLTYQHNIPMDEGTIIGSDENSLLFVSKFENEDFLISSRALHNAREAFPLYQVKNI